MINFKISKDLYPKPVLLKTCFHFLDKFYLFLDADENNYLVEIKQKNDSEIILDVKEQFFNELIAQNTRYTILNETSDIRKLMLARAFSSTMVDDASLISQNTNSNTNMFKDWFDNDENKAK